MAGEREEPRCLWWEAGGWPSGRGLTPCRALFPAAPRPLISLLPRKPAVCPLSICCPHADLSVSSPLVPFLAHSLHPSACGSRQELWAAEPSCLPSSAPPSTRPLTLCRKQ